MSTTSLKLPDELKKRAAMVAAAELGISPHAFMVGAIRNAADARRAAYRVRRAS